MNKFSDNFLSEIYSSVAQSVERLTVNQDVTGSSPVRGAKLKKSETQCVSDFFVFYSGKPVFGFVVYP